MPETPWLREMADEDLQVLFYDDEETVREPLRSLIRKAREDMDLEERLIDLVDTSVELENDDTMGSVWAIVALAEVPSVRATSVLLRVLAMESDELLQDVSGVALLRLGAPALEILMEALDEEECGVALRRQGYAVLGRSGQLDDPGFCRRVEDFFESALAAEQRFETSEQALEELALAIAELGARSLYDSLTDLLRERFAGANVAVEDALARLEDNEDGVPFVSTRAPWQERYGWLFEDEADDEAEDEEATTSEGRDAPTGIEPFGLNGPRLS